jgi:hypothetical protein
MPVRLTFPAWLLIAVAAAFVQSCSSFNLDVPDAEVHL